MQYAFTIIAYYVVVIVVIVEVSQDKMVVKYEHKA